MTSVGSPVPRWRELVMETWHSVSFRDSRHGPELVKEQTEKCCRVTGEYIDLLEDVEKPGSICSIPRAVTWSSRASGWHCKESEHRQNKKRRSEDQEPTPGSSQDATTSGPYPGFTNSRFILHKMLGRGSFGKVFLASVPGRKTFMAIKTIEKTEDDMDTIVREQQILAAARECPFICHLYAAHHSEQRAYIITEYLSGGSLADLIKMCGSLNIGNVRFYTAEIICGLQFLHGQGIVHRDIKPTNIMLDAEGHTRIIDLGLALDGITTTTKICGVTGTFHYMAPEVHFKPGYGIAVDWWSLGIVVSKMSTGHHPLYEGSNRREAFIAKLTKKPEFPPDFDADLKQLIENLLCKNPRQRMGLCRNIREHPFFSTIGWEELEQRRARPPFTPFQPVLEKEHLQWPEDRSALQQQHNYTSPSWDALQNELAPTAQNFMTPPCLCCSASVKIVCVPRSVLIFCVPRSVLIFCVPRSVLIFCVPRSVLIFCVPRSGLCSAQHRPDHTTPHTVTHSDTNTPASSTGDIFS
ncbi:protein kinase C theta type-like [Leptodactylus fuscus]